MNEKPDFKSYLLRQLSFKKYPWIIRAKDGFVYEEIKGKLHEQMRVIFWFIVSYILLHISYLTIPFIWGGVKFLLTVFIFPSIVMFLIISILYKISKFKIIEEERLEEYPEIKV
jgi:hypothetical protein